jgi:hypothetical protein
MTGSLNSKGCTVDSSQRRRVLLISADGMRPDLFDPTLMPVCADLVASGTRLIDYHASYPTHSRVNITTISTGCLPGKHGFAANVFRVDGTTEDGVIDTGDFGHISQLDAATGNRAIQVPTLPELLFRHSVKSQVVATSSDAAGLIWNRFDPEAVFDLNTSVERPGIAAVRDKLGPVPPESMSNRIPHIAYTARALSEHYLDDDDTDFYAVWLSEPDHSLHHFGIGSPEVADALRAVDGAVAEILDGLERRGIRDQFDIFLISDHGHSSIDRHRTLGEFIEREIRDRFPGLRGLTTASDFIYAPSESPTPSATEIAPLVAWLQEQSWCGAVFGGTNELAHLPGVLPLSAIWGGIESQRAPLLAVTPTWSHASNRFGKPGMIAGLTEQVALRSTHGSASPYELHAFAALSGSSFQSETRSLIPSGAQDLAPTICTILGIPVSDWMDGRVLTEAFATGKSTPESTVRVVAPDQSQSAEYRPALIMRTAGRSQYLHSAVNARSSVRSSLPAMTVERSS